MVVSGDDDDNEVRINRWLLVVMMIIMITR